MPTPEEPDASRVVSLEELGIAECLDLLATTSVGRVGFVVDDRPVVLPVNYVVEGHNIVFRTAEGTILTQVALQVVAFEADQIDEMGQTGWSVLAQGVASDVSDAVDTKSERLRRLSLVTWAPGHRPRWFSINAKAITGRRLRLGPDAS